ncbi:MAG: ISL3 family transposase [Oxalobacteraceae bacterium]|nr:MAG: ISL3 family transposase [Oxalobacteraceae bacterium]
MRKTEPIASGCPNPGDNTEAEQRTLRIRSHSKTARCPDCQCRSRSVHTRYTRTAADLPTCGTATRLLILVRRFYCKNISCSRRTFAEQLSDVISPYARRTRRLAHIQSKIAIACGGEAGSRLLHALAMDTSGDSLLRLIRRTPLPPQASPRVVGVDDWALKKGCSYGTVVVDLERHRVIDLLGDRRAQTLAAWLEKKSGDRFSRARPLNGVSQRYPAGST